MEQIEITFQIPRTLSGRDLSRERFSMADAAGAEAGEVAVLESGPQALELMWTVDRGVLPPKAAFSLRCAGLDIPASEIYKTTREEDAGLNTLEDVINACSLCAQSAKESERLAAEYAGQQRAASNVTLAAVDGLTAVNVQRAVEELAGRTGGPGTSGGDGATFIPAVSGEGVISWRNDAGLENPPPVNLKGPPGQAGRDGLTTSVNHIAQADGNISLSAAAIPITGIDGMQAGNVQEALAANFQSVVDGKASVEAAINGKGGTVSKSGETATFEELIDGVASIEAGSAVNETLPPQVSGFYGENISADGQGKIRVHWDNPASDFFTGVAIVRKENACPTGFHDGALIYDGAADVCEDSVKLDTPYGYRAYPYNSSGQYQTDITNATFTASASSSVELSTVVSLGSKILFGSYKGEKIKWVVADINNASYPADTVTLLAERIIAYKLYGYQMDSSGVGNYYGSQLQKWLESSDEASESSIYQEDGFLYEFLPPERSVIVPCTLVLCNGQYKAPSSMNATGPFLPSMTELLNWKYLRTTDSSGPMIYVGTYFTGIQNGVVSNTGLGFTRQAWSEINPDSNPTQNDLDNTRRVILSRDFKATQWAAFCTGVPNGPSGIFQEYTKPQKVHVKPCVNIDAHARCKPVPNEEGYFELAV